MKRKTYLICTKKMEETFQLGYNLARIVKGVVCLQGDLGSGKTVMAKGIAKGLGVDDYITSPTFNIINHYKGEENEFYHMDAYRLESPEDLYDIGFEDILYPEGISVIEWADKIRNNISNCTVWIIITKSEDEDTRLILITADEEVINRLGSEYIK